MLNYLATLSLFQGLQKNGLGLDDFDFLKFFLGSSLKIYYMFQALTADINFLGDCVRIRTIGWVLAIRNVVANPNCGSSIFTFFLKVLDSKPYY